MQREYENLFLSGTLEAYSYLLLLFIAMPLKYIWNMPEYVKIIGSIHGALTILFIAMISIVHIKNKITFKKSVIAFLLSFLPFGTFFLRSVYKTNALHNIKPN